VELVLALDPGRTTGYALGYRHETLDIAYGETRFSHGELWDFLRNVNPHFIVCESFDYRRLKDVDLYPCELIGIVHLYASMQERSVFLQKPSIQGSKDAYWSDAKLKEYDLYKKGTEHGRSALKHLLYWLQFGHGAQFGEVDPMLTGVSWFLDNHVKGGDNLVGT